MLSYVLHLGASAGCTSFVQEDDGGSMAWLTDGPQPFMTGTMTLILSTEPLTLNDIGGPIAGGGLDYVNDGRDHQARLSVNGAYMKGGCGLTT